MDFLDARSGADPAAVASLLYAFHHVFLPPKTPHEDDTSISEEHNLIKFLLESTERFSEACGSTASEQLGRVVRMLQRFLRLLPGLESSNKKNDVANVIRELKNGGTFLLHSYF